MARLIVLMPRGKRLVYEIEREATIGRNADNTISIPELHISKSHCRITAVPDGYQIEDLGSTNGTHVDGVRISTPNPLQNGARISLGGTSCVFLIEDRRVLPAEEAECPPMPFQPAVPPPAAGLQKPDSLHVMQAVFTPKQPGMVQGRIAFESGTFQPEKAIRDVEFLRRDYEKLRIAHELMQAVGHEIDLDRVLGRILECVFAMLPANRGVVLLYEPGGSLVPRATRMRKERPDEEFMISTSMVKRIEEEHIGILLLDAAGDPRFQFARSVIAQGIRSAMAVPLLYADTLLGIVIIDSQIATHAFSEKDLQLLTTLASQAALLVANAGLARKNEEAAESRARLQRLFSPSIAEYVASGKLEVKQGGVPMRATMLFSDIRNFTSMSEAMNAEEIVQMLNAYFELMVDVVFSFDGTLDKFVGDGMIALFGAPAKRPDDAIRAVRTALRMQEALNGFNASREAAGKLPIKTGIGINTGDVVAGYIGSSKALQYTVIGAPVNLASRLCSLARDAHRIIISESTWSEVRDRFDTQELDPVPIKGISVPVKTFAVLGERH
ncbi:MAG TPA: adenylate/guanylate cyclase domain-containing protein [Candidatus Ozemobacteraceae bacterium]|nr:adenylate/guanylate cyclase domain-containing protein [Candidatus Ozemobacteraceae bacterium]